MTKPVSTKMKAVDRVLGGGIAPGGVYLLGAPHGVGCTTLARQIASSCASKKFPVMFLSGEMSAEDTAAYAQRLGVTNKNVLAWGCLEGLNVDYVLDDARETDAKLVIVDSLQVCFLASKKGAIGSRSQIDASAMAVIDYARKENVAVILISHFTKAGGFGVGQKVLHAIDCELALDLGTGDERVLSVGKHRYGRSGVKARLRMTEKGFV